MTEEEWLECADPQVMLRYLQRKTNDRKARLFACGCVRRIYAVLTDERSRNAIEAAQRFADNLAGNEEREAAFAAAENATEPLLAAVEVRGEYTLDFWAASAAVATLRIRTRPSPAECDPIETAAGFSRMAAGVDFDRPDVASKEEAAQAALLRDIFGNPFRPVTVEPVWRTTNVVALAQAIYDDRAFDRLPILADALEDAGCTNAEILTHCRQPGEHVLGCWLIDLVLAKE
jgi:hypothetical protein